MNFSEYSYACSHCDELVCMSVVLSWYNSGSSRPVDLHSDGYFYIIKSLPPQSPFVKCPLCMSIQRRDDLTLVSRYFDRDQYPDYPEEDDDGYDNPRDVRGLKIDDYFQLLVDPVYDLNSDEELYVRTTIRRHFNRFLINYSMYKYEPVINYAGNLNPFALIRLPKRCEIGNAFWRENLLRIIEITPHDTNRQLLSIADAHRSLGNFREALSILSAAQDLIHAAEPSMIRSLDRALCLNLIHACKRRKQKPFVCQGDPKP